MYTQRPGDPPNWIPKHELVENTIYQGQCRNADHAQWKNGKFHYIRYKFGQQFFEDIECPEDDQGFDVFFPFRKVF